MVLPTVNKVAHPVSPKYFGSAWRFRQEHKMDYQNNTPFIEISASSLNIDAIVASFADDAELNESLRSATVLIVPTDLGLEYEGPAFPLSTRELFQFLRTGFADKATVEVAVRDEDFREFDYRSDCLILPVLYISSQFWVPLAVNLLGAYIYDKFKNRLGSNASRTVKSEIHFTDPSGAQVTFKYEGSASTYEKVSADHLRELGVWLEGVQLPNDDK